MKPETGLTKKLLLLTICVPVFLLGCDNDNPKGTVSLIGKEIRHGDFNSYRSYLIGEAKEKFGNEMAFQELRRLLGQYEKVEILKPQHITDENDVRTFSVNIRGRKKQTRISTDILKVEVRCAYNGVPTPAPVVGPKEQSNESMSFALLGDRDGGPGRFEPPDRPERPEHGGGHIVSPPDGGWIRPGPGGGGDNSGGHWDHDRDWGNVPDYGSSEPGGRWYCFASKLERI